MAYAAVMMSNMLSHHPSSHHMRRRKEPPIEEPEMIKHFDTYFRGTNILYTTMPREELEKILKSKFRS